MIGQTVQIFKQTYGIAVALTLVVISGGNVVDAFDIIAREENCQDAYSLLK